jgi:hypothetical protein
VAAVKLDCKLFKDSVCFFTVVVLENWVCKLAYLLLASTILPSSPISSYCSSRYLEDFLGAFKVSSMSLIFYAVCVA